VEAIKEKHLLFSIEGIQGAMMMDSQITRETSSVMLKKKGLEEMEATVKMQ